MISLSQVIQHAYPAALSRINFEVSDNSDGDGPFISMWDVAALGPQPTVQQLATARTAAQAAFDTAATADATERTQIQQILDVADDMINSVGTAAQRQTRVEVALGRLLKRLAKTGVIP